MRSKLELALAFQIRASEASVIASLERKIQELATNKKPLSDQGQFCAPSA